MDNLLEVIAVKIAEWFPELNGRSVAVMDAEITKENLPTLPICMVAPIRVLPPVPNAQGYVQELVDEVLIEFWLEPTKLRKEDGSESVFWAYLDYKPIQNKLIYNFQYWDVPGCIATYQGLQFDTTPFAHTLAFRFSFKSGFCYAPPKDTEPLLGARKDGDPIKIVPKLV